jgi:hypothetical protein
MMAGSETELRREMDAAKSAREYSAQVLRGAGFYAVANGWEDGRHEIAWVIDHIEKTIPRRNERGQELARRALARFRSLEAS